jgi:hypothetical protein
MTHEIIDATVDDDRIDVSRWTKYGKDRLYINRLGLSWNNFYADLDGDEGHCTPGVRSTIDIDGSVVTVSWTRSNESVREVVIDLDPAANDDMADEDEDESGGEEAEGDGSGGAAEDGGRVSKVPPEVPYNGRTAGIAQQINAQRLADGDEP